MHRTKRVTVAPLSRAGERHLACQLEILGHVKGASTNQAYTVLAWKSEAGCLAPDFKLQTSAGREEQADSTCSLTPRSKRKQARSWGLDRRDYLEP